MIAPALRMLELKSWEPRRHHQQGDAAQTLTARMELTTNTGGTGFWLHLCIVIHTSTIYRIRSCNPSLKALHPDVVHA